MADETNEQTTAAVEAPADEAKGGKSGKDAKGAKGGKDRGRPAEAAPPPRLHVYYREVVLLQLQRELGLPNPMRVPRLEKIAVNMGVGDSIRDGKLLDAALADLALITGQKPAITRARKSIAQFKLREGMPIGAKVTLRGARMWEFLDRLLSTALPRIRDFRGLDPDAFDGGGNYSIGVTEQLIFPEIDYDKVVKVRGMDITVVTSARTDDEGRALLQALGFPFAGIPVVAALAGASAAS
jgi:large subunit ribosomal protein L5